VTVSAIGQRFNLEKVMETAFGIVRTLQGRASMRFSEGDAPTFAFNNDDDQPRPFDEESYSLISALYKECRESAFDVTLFGCSIHFGPFLVDLFLMGFDCLHGSVGNCLTDQDLNWDQLDPTPAMFVMMGRGMIDPIVGAHHDFLTKTLDSYRSQGIVWEPYDEFPEVLAFCVRFPHEAFGAGHGTIRICRYPHDHVRQDRE
jgi:hypothetical protein